MEGEIKFRDRFDDDRRQRDSKYEDAGWTGRIGDGEDGEAANALLADVVRFSVVRDVRQDRVRVRSSQVDADV